MGKRSPCQEILLDRLGGLWLTDGEWSRTPSLLGAIFQGSVGLVGAAVKLRTALELKILRVFFKLVKGRTEGFRFKDWAKYGQTDNGTADQHREAP